MQADISKSYKLFIGGEWVNAKSGETLNTYCPANGELLSTCQAGGKDDVDLAVKAAWAAFNEWKDMSNGARSNIMFKIADLLEKNTDRLAKIETVDNGMPIRTSRVVAHGLSETFRFYGGLILSEEGGAQFLDKNTLKMFVREPIGVVGSIVPWNVPFGIACNRMAPALAAGNTTVVKPSSETPVSILEVAKIISEVLPPGVLNVIPGRGATTGQYLLDHPGISKFSFTGSTEIGYAVADAAAKKMIPATLELGGKSANVFFPDCPWEKSIEGAALGVLWNNGQACVAGSRAFVHEDIYDKFMVPRCFMWVS